MSRETIMGLDTTHDCWHGSYSNFMQFRIKLAQAIGADLKSTWEQEKEFDHDLHPLLNHSDCDGALTVYECKRTLNGLKQVIQHPDIKSDEYILDKCNKFIAGLELAISKNEPVLFH